MSVDDPVGVVMKVVGPQRRDLVAHIGHDQDAADDPHFRLFIKRLGPLQDLACGDLAFLPIAEVVAKPFVEPIEFFAWDHPCRIPHKKEKVPKSPSRVFGFSLTPSATLADSNAEWWNDRGLS